MNDKAFEYVYNNFDKLRTIDDMQILDSIADSLHIRTGKLIDYINTIWYTKFNMKYYV